jgi:hypothetical protein
MHPYRLEKLKTAAKIKTSLDIRLRSFCGKTVKIPDYSYLPGSFFDNCIGTQMKEINLFELRYLRRRKNPV